MKFLRYILPLFLLAGMVFGQSGATVQTNFTAAASSVAIPAAQFAYHRLVISNASTTFTACTIAIDSSPDGTTWTAGGIMASTPNNCLLHTVFYTTTPATSKFVRVTVTTLTGTGLNVDITYFGSSTPYEKEACVGTPTPINLATAATTQIVGLSTGVPMHICHIDIQAAGTTSVTIVGGSGSNCGTNTVTLSGPYPLTATSPPINISNYPEAFFLPAGNAICITNSAAVQISGMVVASKF